MKSPRPEDLSTQQRLSLIRQTTDVLKKQPNNVVARYNLGLLLKANKERGAAIDQFKKAHKLAPDDMDILTMLAESCEENRNYTLARKYARMLVEKFPKDASCRMFYAGILAKMGKPDLAMKQYEVTRRLEPNHPRVLFEMAQTARMSGEIDNVQQFQDELQGVDPLSSRGIYSEAHNRKNTLEQAQELESRIEAAITQVNGEDDTFTLAQLYYARGKIWSDAKEYDRAFEAYQAANTISAKRVEPYKKANFDNAIAAYTKDMLLQRQNCGSPTRSPIFIFGMPRSGTTLTESICGAHSKVTPADELTFISSIGEKLGDSSDFTDAFRQSFQMLGNTDFQRSAKYYLDKTTAFRIKSLHFTDKMPHNFMRLGLIKILFPNASLIHVRRHPIDNCLSIFTNSMNDFHVAYKSDLTRLGLYYRQYWQLMQHWRENIPGGFHEVYYEDVVANTELNARKMIDYIGLEWEDSIANRQKSQKSVRTLSAWQVRQPVYTSSAGRWKQYEKHLGPLIDALGPVVEEYENELKSLAG